MGCGGMICEMEGLAGLKRRPMGPLTDRILYGAGCAAADFVLYLCLLGMIPKGGFGPACAAE